MARDLLTDLFEAMAHVSAGFVVLPSQLGDTHDCSDSERLMIAIVFQAWVDLQNLDSKVPSRLAEAREAEAFFKRRRAYDAGAWPFCFAAICDQFGWSQQWWCEQLFDPAKRKLPPPGRRQDTASAAAGFSPRRRMRKRELGLTVSGVAPAAHVPGAIEPISGGGGEFTATVPTLPPAAICLVLPSPLEGEGVSVAAAG